MLGRPPPDPSDPEQSPRARTRDRVRYATAGATSVTAVLCSFLLHGQQALQADLARTADQVATLGATIERVQAAGAAAQTADRLAHAAIDARLGDCDQRARVVALTLEALGRADGELGTRVTRLERLSGDAPLSFRAGGTRERLAQLVAAIGELKTDAPGAWTADHRPTTGALAAATGTPVTAAERDMAWSVAHLIPANSSEAPDP